MVGFLCLVDYGKIKELESRVLTAISFHTFLFVFSATSNSFIRITLLFAKVKIMAPEGWQESWQVIELLYVPCYRWDPKGPLFTQGQSGAAYKVGDSEFLSNFCQDLCVPPLRGQDQPESLWWGEPTDESYVSLVARGEEVKGSWARESGPRGWLSG